MAASLTALVSSLTRTRWTSAGGSKPISAALAHFRRAHNTPRIGRILMATGRDATDVAISTTFGTSTLVHFEVITEQVANGVVGTPAVSE